VRRRNRSVENELADITHPADGDPKPGVADIGVPPDVGLWQPLSWAPLVRHRVVVRGIGAVNLRRQTGVGLGSTGRERRYRDAT
jgi:hypothetical protein